MSSSYIDAALRRLVFFALSTLLLSGCGTDPWTQAAHDMDRRAFEREIAAAKDVQTGRNSALTTALYWTRVREPHRSFHTKLYKDLLAQGANPYQVLDSIISMASGNPYAIDLLKETGFDLNARSADGNTLILSAASLGGVQTVERLIAHGVNLDARGGMHNATPLGIAIMNWSQVPVDPAKVAPGYPKYQADEIDRAGKVAKLLLAAGAKVDGRMFDDDRTPAMQAALSNRPDIVNLLVSKGANVQLKDKDGDDVAAYFAMGKHKNDVRLAKKQAEQQAARERRQMLGQVVGTVATAAVVSNMSMSAENKAQVIGAVASDLGTGGAAATSSLASSLSSSAQTKASVANSEPVPAPLRPQASAASSMRMPPTAAGNPSNRKLGGATPGTNVSTASASPMPVPTAAQKKKYPLVRTYSYLTMGVSSAADTCKEVNAKIDAFLAKTDGKLMSRAQCDCKEERDTLYGKYWNCQAPVAIQVMVDYDPSVPSSNTSR